MIHRSAITGRFVSARYAKRHPKTTIREKSPPLKGQGRVGKWRQRRNLAKPPRKSANAKEWTG